MPQIIPIKDLKNTSEISDMCHKAAEPIYVTKNGYGDMVIMSNKFEDLINAAKVSELLHKKELEEKNKNAIVIVLAVLGAIAAVAGIAFAVYKYLTPDYLEDFDPDDYSDDFDDDYIEFSDREHEAED